MEKWDFCRGCDRWFSSPRTKEAGQQTCPVCGVRAHALTGPPPGVRPPPTRGRGQAPRGPASADIDGAPRSRAGRGVGAATAVVPGVRIQGLCQKCREWFDCHDWFDQALPQPCCPACGLGPIRLQYQPPQGNTITIGLSPSDLWIG